MAKEAGTPSDENLRAAQRGKGVSGLFRHFGEVALTERSGRHSLSSMPCSANTGEALCRFSSESI